MTSLQNLLRNLPLVDLAVFIAWVILLLPTIFYLLTTWRHRRELLFGKLGPQAIRLYFEQFYPHKVSWSGSNIETEEAEDEAEEEADEEDEEEEDEEVDEIHEEVNGAEVYDDEAIVNEFRRHFARVYGRRYYVFPLVLVAVLSGLGLLATDQSIHAWLGHVPAASAYPPIVISAFLGAYSWVLYDHFRRFRTGDFTTHDIYGAVYRFLIAIPLGLSIAVILKDAVGVALAFFLGAFPTTTLITLMRRLASQKLGLGESGESGILELEKLQCVGRANAERYLDEGISTIAMLAWTDPIDLTIRTNLEFNFVIDSVSQALLWVYFEDRVRKLYPLSLRGAQEVCSLLNDLNSRQRKVKAAAEQNLEAAAELTGLDRESFLYTLISVRDDPYTQFLYSIWA